MILKTVAGRYAGELREYAHTAGVAALQAGTAIRVTPEVVVAGSPRPVPVAVPVTRPTRKKMR